MDSNQFGMSQRWGYFNKKICVKFVNRKFTWSKNPFNALRWSDFNSADYENFHNAHEHSELNRKWKALIESLLVRKMGSLKSDSHVELSEMGVWKFLEPRLLRHSPIHKYKGFFMIERKCESHISENCTHPWNKLQKCCVLCEYCIPAPILYSPLMENRIHAEKQKLPFLSIKACAHDIRNVQNWRKL